MAPLLQLFKNIFADSSSERLKCIYVFETSKLSSRLKANCFGSVNSSFLRELIAIRMGYEVVKQTDASENEVRYQIAGDVDRSIEHRISEYIRNGWWSWCSFNTLDEANDFYAYARTQLKPELDNQKKDLNLRVHNDYQKWMRKLLNQQKITPQQIDTIPKTAAIAAFYHEVLPEYYS